jgi:hypothetical protein
MNYTVVFKSQNTLPHSQDVVLTENRTLLRGNAAQWFFRFISYKANDKLRRISIVIIDSSLRFNRMALCSNDFAPLVHFAKDHPSIDLRCIREFPSRLGKSTRSLHSILVGCLLAVLLKGEEEA